MTNGVRLWTGGDETTNVCLAGTLVKTTCLVYWFTLILVWVNMSCSAITVVMWPEGFVQKLLHQTSLCQDTRAGCYGMCVLHVILPIDYKLWWSMESVFNDTWFDSPEIWMPSLFKEDVWSYFSGETNWIEAWIKSGCISQPCCDQSLSVTEYRFAVVLNFY